MPKISQKKVKTERTSFHVYFLDIINNFLVRTYAANRFGGTLVSTWGKRVLDLWWQTGQCLGVNWFLVGELAMGQNDYKP